FRYLLEPPHALLVLDTLGFEPRDQLVLRAPGLLVEDRTRALLHRLDHAEHLERVALRIRVERGHRLDEIERERVVQREVGLEVRGDAHLAPAVARGAKLDHAPRDQRAEQRRGAAALARLRSPALVRAVPEPDHRAVVGAALALEHAEDHAVTHLELRAQCLGRALHELLERLARPRPEVARRPVLPRLARPAPATLIGAA